MANEPSLDGDAEQLWQDVLDNLRALKDPLGSVEETILFHGTVPRRYVQLYSLSFAQWLDMPLLCWKFYRGRASTGGTERVDHLNLLLSKIEFACKPLTPLEVQRARRARLRHNLSEQVAFHSFREVGMRAKRGKVHAWRQPLWCYWAGKGLQSCFVASALLVLGVAIAPVVTSQNLPLGSVTLFMLAIVLSWMADIAASFGVGWRRADATRELMGF